MTHRSHAQALKLYRANLGAPLAIKKKSAAASPRNALENMAQIIVLVLMLAAPAYIGITTARETDRLMLEYSSQLAQAEKAAELEMLWRNQ